MSQEIPSEPAIVPQLDHGKIKEYLSQNILDPSKEVEVCATLQALSWRITKVRKSIRKVNLHFFQMYDVLEL